MRREFSKQVRRDTFARCAGKCEGENCGAKLFPGGIFYDHRIPDALGGGPTLENCQVLCRPCHDEKTRKEDVPRIAKAKRVSDLHRGIKKPSRFACGRNSKFKKKITGEVVLRRLGI